MYQVSTLQALALGYTRTVIEVAGLLEHGNIGLGTYTDVNGEMITVDGQCYRALEDGSVVKAGPGDGVPFCAVSFFHGDRTFETGRAESIKDLKTLLDLKIEEKFGLNSMHMVRIDGHFDKVMARSEAAYESQHVELKDILSKTQKEFEFDDIDGTLVCVYFPDYMDGINAPGWHLHFISEDRTRGGHVFELALERGTVSIDKINNIEIKLPSEPAFDTYSLKTASGEDIKKVEQGAQ
jgi:acetolactate decarboxylase